MRNSAADERAKDPLIEFAAATNARISRTPASCRGNVRLDQRRSLAANRRSRRIRHATCLFSDIGWRRHPDDRAIGAFNQVLTAPFAGADHRRPRPDRDGRLSTAIPATRISRASSPAQDLLSEDDELRATTLGLACAAGIRAFGLGAGELPHYRLRLTPDASSSWKFPGAGSPSRASRCRSGWGRWPRPWAARARS